jgi:hypothetical protein
LFVEISWLFVDLFFLAPATPHWHTRFAWARALTKHTPHPNIIRNSNKLFAPRILAEPAAVVHFSGEAPLAGIRVSEIGLAPIRIPM